MRSGYMNRHLMRGRRILHFNFVTVPQERQIGASGSSNPTVYNGLLKLDCGSEKRGRLVLFGASCLISER